MTVKYKFLGHTAEVKLRIYGKTRRKIYENFVLAYADLVGRGQKIRSASKKKIKLSGEDDESLMFGFIDELLYLLDAKQFLVSKANLKIKKNVLEGYVFGDKAGKYKGLDHVKAPTYSEMYIKRNVKSKSWEAQVVLDV